jgi:hypothetical protein
VMKKTLFAGVLVTIVTCSGGLLLTTFPASAAKYRAASTCGAQIIKHCGGKPVAGSSHELLACAKLSIKNHSPRCAALADNLVRSCEQDALRLCQSLVAGGSNIVTGCLTPAKNSVSPQCNAAIDAAFPRRIYASGH